MKWRALIVVSFVAALPAESARAGSMLVTTESDVTADDGSCSLREAITAANTDTASGASPGECPAGSGPDGVNLPAGLYRLTHAGINDDANATGDLDVTADVLIAGAGPGSTTISGAHLDRVFDVLPGLTVSILGVTIADGQAAAGGTGAAGATGGTGRSGGGIFNAANLTLGDVVIRDNAAGAGGLGGGGLVGGGGTGGSGGGIFNTGTLTVGASAIRDNTAGAGGHGNDQANQSTGGGAGGAGGGIFSSGTVSIARSTISGNAAGDGTVGGIATGVDGSDGATGGDGGTATAGDGGPGGAGGALAASGPVTLDAVTLAGNHAGDGGDGGGATGGHGGSGAPPGRGGRANAGSGGLGGAGGALAVGALTATNVTFDHNAAGSGAIGGFGFGGTGGSSASTTGGQGGAADGGTGGNGGSGGAMAATGAISLNFATFNANEAGRAGAGTRGQTGFPGTGTSTGPAGQNSSGFSGTAGLGGGVSLSGSGSGPMANTIMSRNTPNSCSGGGPSDGGHNIQFPFGGCFGSTADPLLRSLTANGGPVDTLGLGFGSAAIGVVPAASCLGTDARDVARPQGAMCDAGAFELAPPAVVTGAASLVSSGGATVDGTVTPNAGAAGYYFEYGTSTAYGSRTPDGNAGAGTNLSPVRAAILLLAPTTVYHYRLVATSVDGTTAGADQTFTTAAVATPPDTTDRTAPVFSAVGLAPARFAINAKGKAETVVTARVRKAPKGTTFRYTLSEAARVVVTVQRRLPGRRVGKHCVAPKSSNARKKRCTRYVVVGRFAVVSKAGATKRRFSGRLGKRKLKLGRYRATLRATDAAANRSKPVTLSFTVIRPSARVH